MGSIWLHRPVAGPIRESKTPTLAAPEMRLGAEFRIPSWPPYGLLPYRPNPPLCAPTRNLQSARSGIGPIVPPTPRIRKGKPQIDMASVASLRGQGTALQASGTTGKGVCRCVRATTDQTFSRIYRPGNLILRQRVGAITFWNPPPYPKRRTHFSVNNSRSDSREQG